MELTNLLDELRWRLEAFLNCDTLVPLAKVTYPLIQLHKNTFNKPCKTKSESGKSFVSMLDLLHSLVPYQFPESSLALERTLLSKTLSAKEYASILSKIYRELKDNLPKAYPALPEMKLEVLHTFEAWRARALDARLNPLHRMRTELLEHDHWHKLILHGSTSTLDYTHFSDIDFVIVLKDQTAMTPGKLIKAQRAITRARRHLDIFQPYNHHGFFITTETDINHYRESFLPTSTYKNATLFDDSSAISIRLAPPKSVRSGVLLERFKKTCGEILAMKPKNTYHAFDKISRCLLLPTLYLATRGIRPYKRDSFEIINEFLSTEDREMLRTVENARENWQFKPSLPLRAREFAHTVVNPLLFKEFVKRFPRQKATTRLKDTFNSINRLCERFLALTEELNEN